MTYPCPPVALQCRNDRVLIGAAVGVLAALIPAWRASRLDPITALSEG